MDEHLEKQIETLRDKEGGWVNRRDAAQWLGDTARDALKALEAHADDSDVDVKAAVSDALRNIVLPDAPAVVEGRRAHTLQDLAEACAKTGKRTVSPTDNGFAIDIQLPDGRKQCVYLSEYKNKDGQSLIRIQTYCGEVLEKAMYWGLKNNLNLLNCALAIIKEDGVRKFVIVENCRKDECTPAQIKRTVKEIATYGDWLEKKLSDTDAF